MGEPDVDGAGLSAGFAGGAKSLAGAGRVGAVAAALVFWIALDGPMPKASGCIHSMTKAAAAKMAAKTKAIPKCLRFSWPTAWREDWRALRPCW